MKKKTKEKVEFFNTVRDGIKSGLFVEEPGRVKRGEIVPLIEKLDQYNGLEVKRTHRDCWNLWALIKKNLKLLRVENVYVLSDEAVAPAAIPAVESSYILPASPDKMLAEARRRFRQRHPECHKAFKIERGISFKEAEFDLIWLMVSDRVTVGKTLWAVQDAHPKGSAKTWNGWERIIEKLSFYNINRFSIVRQGNKKYIRIEGTIQDALILQRDLSKVGKKLLNKNYEVIKDLKPVEKQDDFIAPTTALKSGIDDRDGFILLVLTKLAENEGVGIDEARQILALNRYYPVNYSSGEIKDLVARFPEYLTINSLDGKIQSVIQNRCPEELKKFSPYNRAMEITLIISSKLPLEEIEKVIGKVVVHYSSEEVMVCTSSLSEGRDDIIKLARLKEKLRSTDKIVGLHRPELLVDEMDRLLRVAVMPTQLLGRSREALIEAAVRV